MDLMGAGSRTRLPQGHQPYDPLNGFRVGAMAGALLGALGVLVLGTGAIWLIFVGATGGGLIGYRSEKRKLGGR
jgi:uncharacterized protein YcfJ